jgi:hypothetical protein
MPTHRHLATEHQQALEKIFSDAAPGRLEWADVFHLIEAVGKVNDKGHGVYQFIVNGEHHEFTRPKHDAITDAEEIDQLRKFLTRGRMTP